MKKKTKEIIETNVKLFLFLTMLFALIFSCQLYWTGVHNSDLGQNMKYLEARLNIDLIDKTSDFTYIDGTDAYIMGENQQKKALYCILLSVIGLFGMFVTELWRIEDGFF